MKARLICALILATGTLAVVTGLVEQHQSDAALHILDVGQGDAILLRAGSADILVDGGPDASVLRQLGAARPVWDRHIEILVLTHPQQDHLAGLLPLLERESIGLVLLPRVPAASDLFRAFVEGVLARDIPVRFADSGQRVQAQDLTITVLAPSPRALALALKNPNHGSIVLRVDVGGSFSALLTGDIERGAEHLLVQDWGVARIVERSSGEAGQWKHALDTDVLKVPHHGSKTSTSVRLLRAVNPSLAVVSVGLGNRYGHPHADVFTRLSGVPVLRTDAHGTVSLVARGGRTALLCHQGRRSVRGSSWDRACF